MIRAYYPSLRGMIVCIALAAMSAAQAAVAASSLADQPASVTIGSHTVTVVVPPELEPRYQALPLPPLTEAAAGPERKSMFIDYLVPIVRKVNHEMLQRRAALLRVQGWLQSDRELSPHVRQWVAAMSQRYRVRAPDLASQVQQLTERMDIIPVSLAISQAALESAWGTSRFALLGNNLFGKWCFIEGCGIVPARRAVGAKHEVAAYPDVADAVRDYIHHLNSHPIYAELRKRRAAAREAGEVPRGSDLAAGLDRYSAKGQEYVTIIRGVIRTNDLAALDSGG